MTQVYIRAYHGKGKPFGPERVIQTDGDYELNEDGAPVACYTGLMGQLRILGDPDNRKYACISSGHRVSLMPTDDETGLPIGDHPSLRL